MTPRSGVSTPLLELAGLFLRLGLTAFGGPAAHIAMMRHEVVDRRHWLTDAEFLDLLAATHLIPGPNSTEMAIHLGFRREGLRGLLVAGAGFILPASLLVGGLAWIYVRFGEAPQIGWIMYGVGPVIIVIVAQALWKLGRTAVKGPLTLTLGVSVAVLALVGWNELGLLVVAGLLMVAVRRGRPGLVAVAGLALSAPVPLAAETGHLALQITLPRLTLFFLKVGSVLFGSGYVLLAFLRADLVERWGWLTDTQLIDAVTVGQVTPGPVFTTATFIGYVLSGWVGAGLATLGIFLPGFLFVAGSHPFIPRLRAAPTMSAILDGVVVASLGLMATVTWTLTRAAIIDVPTAGVAVFAAVILLRSATNTTWVILAGAVFGAVWQGPGL